MKTAILIMLLAASAAVASDKPADHPKKAFAHTYTCAIILARAAADAQPRMIMRPNVPHDSSGRVFIGVWAEMRAAATVYENAANRYLGLALEDDPTEYGPNSAYVMQDATRQNLAEMSKEAKVKYGQACLEGYRLASEAEKSKKNKYNL